jgi:Putative carbonic anhydrase
MTSAAQQREPEKYVARALWSPARPQTLVVCCSDGRWHAPIEEYVDHHVSEHADLYCVPGGPAAFDPWNSSFDEARVLDQAMRMFLEYHDLRGIWLMQHQGCAYYRMKHGAQDEAKIKERQIVDLRRAHELIVERLPHMRVKLVYVEHEGDKVVFTTVDPQPGQVR